MAASEPSDATTEESVGQPAERSAGNLGGMFVIHKEQNLDTLAIRFFRPSRKLNALQS